MGRGGGQVVSILAFYSGDPSSYPVKIVFEKNRNKQKETGLAFFKTKTKREVRFGSFFKKKKLASILWFKISFHTPLFQSFIKMAISLSKKQDDDDTTSSTSTPPVSL